MKTLLTDLGLFIIIYLGMVITMGYLIGVF